jgi:DNA-binding beta-propeller fold protein YncE
VTDDGTLFVMENLGNRLQVFDKEGKSLAVLDGGALQTHSPNGISVGPDGSLYIAVTGQSRVLKLSPGPNMEGAISITGTDEQVKIEQPVDVAVDEKRPERIYAIDLRERLMLLSPDGNIEKQWRLSIGKDDGGSRLVVSNDGSRIYMSDPDRQRISVLDLESGAVEYIGTPGSGAGEFRAPSGIDVGPDGRLYVLDRVNNNVQVFELGR